MVRVVFILPFLGSVWFPFGNLQAQSIASPSISFVSYAMKLRQNALSRISPNLVLTPSRLAMADAAPRYPASESLTDRAQILEHRLFWKPWKRQIVTTVFWIGESPSAGNPVPNDRSSWDAHWFANYGGYDDPRPSARRDFAPFRFVPRENPFYIALPYNDIDRGHTKAEASQVVPWFGQAFQRDGQTVLKGRWVAIRKGAKICYAQWEDCGPFRTDHWQYVFGNERPKPNANGGAGLDVSPAVRDYLGLASGDLCDWTFMDEHQVPPGPWAKYTNQSRSVIATDRTLLRERPALESSRAASLAGPDKTPSNSAESPSGRSF